jgi:hypothetical protein
MKGSRRPCRLPWNAFFFFSVTTRAAGARRGGLGRHDVLNLQPDPVCDAIAHAVSRDFGKTVPEGIGLNNLGGQHFFRNQDTKTTRETLVPLVGCLGYWILGRG